ncbi:major facilitator superfamily domain-containing protein, partial [Blyttiomyces helicus]
SLVVMVLFLPISPIASWMLDVKGSRLSIIVGTVLTFIGAAIRWAAVKADVGAPRYAVTMFGQVLIAIGQPTLLAAPTKVAADWFGEKERTTANTIMSLSNPIGSAIFLGLAPVIVTGSGSNPEPNNIPNLNFALACLSLLAAIGSLFIYDTPPTPPSRSAGMPSDPFLPGMKKLVRNRSYIILFVVFGFMIGIFNTFVTLINDYVTPYGYTDNDAGNVGVALIASGIISAGIVGPIMDRTLAHQLALKICTLLGTAGLVVFTFGCDPNRIGTVFAGAILMGAGGFPLLAVCLELGVECSWPIAEGTTAGGLWFSANFFGIIFLLISNLLRNPDSTLRRGLIFVACMAATAFCASLFYSTPNHRANHDRAEGPSAPAVEEVAVTDASDMAKVDQV